MTKKLLFALFCICGIAIGLWRFLLWEKSTFAQPVPQPAPFTEPLPSLPVPVVTAPNVIEVPLIVIVGSKNRPIPKTKMAPLPAPSAQEDGDPLHAKQHGWDCRVSESAFGGRYRACGPREKH